MKLFGLTGGIGMGKSTSASLLEKHGMPVIDTDVIARDIVEPGEPALQEIIATFGREMLGSDGRLRRGALAAIVFSNPERLKELEAILHPRIRDRWMAWAEERRREGQRAAAVVIPLLFETSAQGHFSSVVCTACSVATQQERLRARGWSDQQIAQRLAAQWPAEKKMAASNHVLWTEGDVAMHERQVEKLFGACFGPRR
jgi:dephospho-CoA kinase